MRTGRDGDPNQVPEPPVVWNQFIRLRPAGISKLKDVRSTRTAAIIIVGGSTYHDCAFTHVHGPSETSVIPAINGDEFRLLKPLRPVAPKDVDRA